MGRRKSLGTTLFHVTFRVTGDAPLGGVALAVTDRERSSVPRLTRPQPEWDCRMNSGAAAEGG
jgi:hypothetical protein